MAITAKHVDSAKETIILERRSHIDSLVARLREPRVRRILAPMLTGDRARGRGLGRGALDLMIFWNRERHAVEVKLRRDTETETETEIEALDQVARYLDSAEFGEGWLVMLDLRKEPSWSDKLYVREVAHAGQKIHLVGC